MGFFFDQLSKLGLKKDWDPEYPPMPTLSDEEKPKAGMATFSLACPSTNPAAYSTCADQLILLNQCRMRNVGAFGPFAVDGCDHERHIHEACEYDFMKKRAEHYQAMKKKKAAAEASK